MRFPIGRKGKAKRPFCFVFMLLTLVCGLCCCNVGTREEKPYWDAEKSRYVVPEYGLALDVPGEIDWDVADPTNLPEGILFCGANPQYGICTMLISRAARGDRQGATLTEDDAKAIVAEIVRQDAATGAVKYTPIEVKWVEYRLKHRAIRFSTGVKIGEDAVRYSGYIFPWREEVLILVALLPEESEEFMRDIACKSVEGLEM